MAVNQTEPVIVAEKLRKEYGGFTAVSGSTFDVAPGEVFGLVGPNGAGKTTTLKMLAGLVTPTAGSGRVAGRDIADPEMRRVLGFLPEDSALYESMTPRSYLRFFAALYDVDRSTADTRIDRLLDRLGLNYRDRSIGALSKGMTRKVAIARALINDPAVVIFDEPASGLDPRTTRSINEFVTELGAEGKTVVFSAHNLYHVEDVCDRVAIMNEGRIVARGSPAELRETYGDNEYHVYTTVPTESSTPIGEHHKTVVSAWEAVEAVREQVATGGGTVVDVQTKGDSFEEIFLTVAGDDP